LSQTDFTFSGTVERRGVEEVETQFKCFLYYLSSLFVWDIAIEATNGGTA
jgi:hypothetical protein